MNDFYHSIIKILAPDNMINRSRYLFRLLLVAALPWFAMPAKAIHSPLGDLNHQVLLQPSDGRENLTIYSVSYQNTFAGQQVLGVNIPTGRGERRSGNIHWQLLLSIQQLLPTKHALNHLYSFIPAAISSILLLKDSPQLNEHLFIEQLRITAEKISFSIRGVTNDGALEQVWVELFVNQGGIPAITVTNSSDQVGFTVQPINPVTTQINNQWEYSYAKITALVLAAMQISINCKTQSMGIKIN